MPHPTSPAPSGEPSRPSAADPRGYAEQDGTEAGATAEPMSDRRRTFARRVLGGALWSMLGIAALGLTRLGYTALIGRTGEPARLAEVNAQVSLTFIVTFLTAAATGQAAAKFVALTLARDGPGVAAAVRRRLTAWTGVATVLAIGALALCGRLVLPGATVADLAWVGALTATYSAYTFQKSVLYAYDRAGRYAVLEVCADVIALLLTVAAVFWLRGALLAPLVVGYAVFAVGAWWSTPRVRPEPLPDPAYLGREIRGFVALTALGVVASQGFFQATMVVARHLTDGAGAGAYAAAMSLITPAFFLPRALALAFFPAAASAVGAGDLDQLARHTDAVTRFLALSMLPCFALAAMLAGPVIRLIYGTAYADAGGGQVFAVLVAGTLLYVIAVPSVNALSAHDLSLARIPPLASAGGVALGCLVWATLWASGGGSTAPAGVAAGYAAATVVQAGVPLVVARRRLALEWGWLVARLGVALGLGAALVIVAVTTEQAWIVAAAAVVFLAGYAVLAGREVLFTARRLLTLRRAGSDTRRRRRM